MKIATIFLLSFVFANVTISQTIQLKWVVPGIAFYVGDLDNDGIGEIAVEEYQTNIIFYDASTHNQKWEVTLGNSESLYRDYTVFNDFDGNGIKEIIIVKFGIHSGLEELRICDPSTNNTILSFPYKGNFATSVNQHDIIVLNIDNDPTAELLIRANDSLFIYATDITTNSNLELGNVIPSNFKLQQNYPNPFNPSTTIEYTLPSQGRGEIEIFDAVGRLVRTFETENQSAGDYQITFDAKDAKGNILSSGVYYYRLVFNGNAQTKKMLLLK